MLVPKEVFGIANHCDPNSTRYALGGVQFERTKDGVCATATDGRQLVTVAWQEPAAKFKPVPGVNHNARDGFMAIVPIKSCKEAARLQNPKFVDRSLQNVVLLDEHDDKTAPIAALDHNEPRVIRPLKLEGRFPKWRDVIPQYRDAQVVRCSVDPFLLADILKTAGTMVTTEFKGVELTIPLDGSSPLVVSNGNIKGRAVQMTAVLMPMADDAAQTKDRNYRAGHVRDCSGFINLPGKAAEAFLASLTGGQLKLLKSLGQPAEASNEPGESAVSNEPAESAVESAIESAVETSAESSIESKVESAVDAAAEQEQRPSDNTDMETPLESDTDLELAGDTDLELSPHELQELIARLVAEQLAALDAA